jgi:hypothetical protein
MPNCAPLEEDELEAAIVGAAGTLRTMADGTVRLYIDYEPKDRKAVMDAFGAPGTPVATVRLKDGYAAAPAPATNRYGELGPLCREAIDLCNNATFLEYIDSAGISWKKTSEGAKGFILAACCVGSRKELDADPTAGELFRKMRKSFLDWVRARK